MLKKEIIYISSIFLLLSLSGCTDVVGNVVEGIDYKPPELNMTFADGNDPLSNKFDTMVLGQGREGDDAANQNKEARVWNKSIVIPEGGFHIISMDNLEYSPSFLSISVGETVRWVNDDKDRVYSVYSFDAFDLRSGRINPSAYYEYTFKTAGSFDFKDAIIPDKMYGTVVVE